MKFNELLEVNSRESHSRNERLEDKLKRLELQVEEQRRQIVQLEAIPRMTKAELDMPEKGVNKRLFHEPGQSSSPPIPRMTDRENAPIHPRLILRMTRGELTVMHLRKR